jgi:hypothetical protein
VRALVAALALLCTLQTGCDWLNNDNAVDASCDSGPTLGAQCTSVYTTLCAQTQRCNIPMDPNCVNVASAHCPCSVENCDASSCDTEALVGSCQQDLTSEDCNLIVNYEMQGSWPSDCTPFMGQQ